MTENITIWIAFISGALSFLSPCVLPMVPGYLCFIAGAQIEDLTAPVQKNGENSSSHAIPKELKMRIMTTSFLFVMGFSIVFIALGAGASSISFFLVENIVLFSKISGVLIIILGVYALDIIRFPWLNKDLRYRFANKPIRVYSALPIGMAFALGWTPCVGPILATVLSMAAQSQNVNTGIMLLTFYAMGLGIPFLMAAYATEKFISFMQKYSKYMVIIKYTTGSLLIVTGFLIFTNQLNIIAGWLLQAFPIFQEIG